MILQTQRLMEDLYAERIGGALLGDVFTIGADDILAVSVGDGITKEGNELSVSLKTTGGMQFTTGELGVKLKAGGGLSVDVDGIYSTVFAFPAAGLAKSTGSAWDTSVTDNSANWNIAYGWGNHAGLYDAAGTGHSEATSHVGTHESTYNHANYNTAYGWGNHASAGYVTLAGSLTTQILYNNAGTLAGDSGLTFNNDTDVLTATGGYYSSAGAATVNRGVFANVRGIALTAVDATGVNWIRLAGDTEADCMLGLIDSPAGYPHPGSTWDGAGSRAIEIMGRSATALLPYAPISIFMTGWWWNGAAAVAKTIELENKIRTDGTLEFWMELPAGTPIFRFRSDGANNAQFCTHGQPNAEIEFFANVGAGAENLVKMATLDGTGFNITTGSYHGTVIDVDHGGTGKTSVTSNSYLKGNGTGALTERTYTEVKTDLGLGSGDGPTFDHLHLANNIYFGNLKGMYARNYADTTNYLSFYMATDDVFHFAYDAPSDIWIGATAVGNIRTGVNMVLNNNKAYYGKDNDTTTDRLLIGIGSDDVIAIGTSAPSTISIGYGATLDNPVAIRVGAANSQTVTAGANDSAGSGYRYLRVPNV